MKTSEICLVSRGWSRHGKYSGFELLGQYLTKCRIAPEIPLHPGIARRIATFSKHRNYSTDSVRREFGAIVWCALYQPKLVHCLYGDMDFHYLGYAKWFAPRMKLLATFHHPEPELSTRWERCGYRFLRKLDGITCVGRNQIAFFQRILPGTRVYWLPHGVDTNFFRPDAATPRRPKRIFVTGISHRDFDTLDATLGLICSQDPETEIQVSVPFGFRRRFKPRSQVIQLESRLSDEELLQAYREATCTLLCLKDCTASNTLLESLATGCPLVVSDVGGVRDYVTSREAYLVPAHDPKSLAEATLCLLRNRGLQIQLSEHSRQKATEFTWGKIAAKAAQIHQELIAGRPELVFATSAEQRDATLTGN
jgi:glycosyltransferase involved in cell wall biosynthesis